MMIEFGDERLPQRFWDKTSVSDKGCWEWKAAQSDGYGRIRVDGRAKLSHRVAYETLCGQVPVGLDLDHLCRNRVCVNPHHLEPVTRQENCRRGARSTHARKAAFCMKGIHFLTPDNVIAKKDGTKSCRACATASTRAYRKLHRDKINTRKRETRDDATKAREREHRAANQEKIKTQHQAYHAAHRDKILARQRERYFERKA